MSIVTMPNLFNNLIGKLQPYKPQTLTTEPLFKRPQVTELGKGLIGTLEIVKPVKEFIRGFMADPEQALEETRATKDMTPFVAGAALGLSPGGMGARAITKAPKAIKAGIKSAIKAGEEVKGLIGKLAPLIGLGLDIVAPGPGELKGIQKGAKELKPLAQEATKYKSAEEFVMPTINRATKKFELLKSDISKNGIRVPVILDSKTGKILDGQNRIAAIKELGIKEIPFIEIDSSKISKETLNQKISQLTDIWNKAKGIKR